MTSSKYGAIAPYVFHSAEFGSEPIGDWVDDGPDQFVKDLAGTLRPLCRDQRQKGIAPFLGFDRIGVGVV